MALIVALLLLAGMAPGSAQPLLVCRITHLPMSAPSAPAAHRDSCCPREAPADAPVPALSETGCCEWQTAHDSPRLPVSLVAFDMAAPPAPGLRFEAPLAPAPRGPQPGVFARTALRRSSRPRAPPAFS